MFFCQSCHETKRGHVITSGMSIKQQNTILQAKGYKIIFSTPVLETSLTIEGLTDVIDPGIYKDLFFNHRLCLALLTAVLISKAQAEQRARRTRKP